MSTQSACALERPCCWTRFFRRAVSNSARTSLAVEVPVEVVDVEPPLVVAVVEVVAVVGAEPVAVTVVVLESPHAANVSAAAASSPQAAARRLSLGASGDLSIGLATP